MDSPRLQSTELSLQTAFMIDYYQPKGPWNCLLGQCKDLDTVIFIIHSLIHQSNENLSNTHCTPNLVRGTGA